MRKNGYRDVVTASLQKMTVSYRKGRINRQGSYMSDNRQRTQSLGFQSVLGQYNPSSQSFSPVPLHVSMKCNRNCGLVALLNWVSALQSKVVAQANCFWVAYVTECKSFASLCLSIFAREGRQSALEQGQHRNQHGGRDDWVVWAAVQL